MILRRPRTVRSAHAVTTEARPIIPGPPPVGSVSTRRRVPGEGGIWLLVFGDLLVFCTLFAAFLVNRSEDELLFRVGQEQLSQTSGAVNTVLLLTSSLFVVGGVQVFRRSRSPAFANWLFGGAFLCGVGFAVSKYFEYSDKIDHGFGPTTDEFFQYFYLMTGLHLFHLTVGMGCLAFMMVQARHACTGSRLLKVEVGATYWHMVDLLWIVLFALLYMVH